MNHKKVFVLLVVVIFIGAPGFVWSDELTPEEQLGKKLFFDNISDPDWMSCATCHDPDAGWTGPISGNNLHGAVYRGAVPIRFGNRKPPTVAYGSDSPLLDLDGDTWTGGMFWDGRATGWRLEDPLAEQALGPFLNPVEQNNASKRAVLEQVAASKYAGLWEVVYGPIDLDNNIDDQYDLIGLAIAAYEASSEVNQFSSKYDAYLANEVELTDQEAWGLELFENEEKGNCAACHPSNPSVQNPPLFTDFTFDNLGIPKNPENPFYGMDEVYLDDGSAINPEGADWIDLGLGSFLRSLADPSNQGWRNLQYVTNVTNIGNPDLLEWADANDGKHKVPTLRNVDKRPGKGFIKAYGHNGFFKSLEDFVHFYNTRDVEDWPDPEVADNVNTDELGDLGLTAEEEAAIVAFLRTLSDTGKVNKKK
jgi:cytochrome c peroxidase